MFAIILFGGLFVAAIVAFVEYGDKMGCGEIIFFAGVVIFSAFMLYSTIAYSHGGVTL